MNFIDILVILIICILVLIYFPVFKNAKGKDFTTFQKISRVVIPVLMWDIYRVFYMIELSFSYKFFLFSIKISKPVSLTDYIKMSRRTRDIYVRKYIIKYPYMYKDFKRYLKGYPFHQNKSTSDIFTTGTYSRNGTGLMFMLDSFTTVMAKSEQSGKTRYEYYSKKERQYVNSLLFIFLCHMQDDTNYIYFDIDTDNIKGHCTRLDTFRAISLMVTGQRYDDIEYIYAKEMVLRLFLSYMEIGKDLGVLQDFSSNSKVIFDGDSMFLKLIRTREGHSNEYIYGKTPM